MRNALLVIFAECLGGQLFIVSGQALQSEFGLLALGLLALIEALVIVVWTTDAKHDFERARLREEHEEDQAEVGQTSRLPEMRGRAIGKHIHATGDRMRILVGTFFRSVLPMLALAVLGFGAAIWLAHIAFAFR